MSTPARRTTLPLVAIVALLSFTLTACEAETDSPAYDEEPVQQTANSPVTESDKVIEITMREFEYDPAEITIPTGKQVSLKFENVGSVTHEFMAGSQMAENGHGFQEGLLSGVDVHVRKNGEQITEGEHPADMAADTTNDGMAADTSHMDHDAMSGEAAESTSTGADAERPERHEHHGKMVHLEPGDVASMTFTLPESKTGEYAFACFESTGDTSHVQRGMRGTIVVEDGSQAS